MTELASRALDCAHRAPALASQVTNLRRVLWLTDGFMVVEAAAGWMANSLALLADAGHMFADVAALGLALFVAWAARRPATPERTYGYLRLEILAALINGAALFVLSGGIVWEAVKRVRQPPAVEPRVLIAVGLAGVAVNLLSLRLLHRGHQHSLNVRGAYLHILGDVLGSLGAMAAGAVIFTTGWTPADPLISILIALLIVWSGAKLMRDSVEVLLEATPRHVSLREVERRIAGIPGVTGVHDLHVWTLTSGVVAMSGHAVVGDPAANQRVLETVQGQMADLGISHVTMQLERDDTCKEGELGAGSGG
jgi:cobalt-zinc-cadmium efflux system protein